jgi:hypothetical protein
MTMLHPAVRQQEPERHAQPISKFRSGVRQLVDGARALVRNVFVDLDSDPKNTIFLAGTGRSGSSWVASIVNYRNDFRYLFEPFFPARVPLCRNFAYRQYLRAGDDDPAFLDPAARIVSGRIRNDWVDQFNRKIVSRKRMIKDIRANLMLGWLHAHFPQMRMVLVLRHPLADANSRRALGWRSHLQELSSQPKLWSDFLRPYAEAIESAQTDFERYVVLWCVENLVPLRQFGGRGIHLAFYENLCEKPESEIGRLFDYLELPVQKQVFAQLRQPTTLAREESAIMRGGNLVDAWRSEVTAEQRARGMQIVRSFGLDVIYGESSMPDVAAALRFPATT